MNQEDQVIDIRPLTTKEKIKQYNRQYNRVWAKTQYHIDPEFREKQLKRNGDYVKNRYATDPEYRQRMIDNAKARHQRLKGQVEQ